MAEQKPRDLSGSLRQIAVRAFNEGRGKKLEEMEYKPSPKEWWQRLASAIIAVAMIIICFFLGVKVFFLLKSDNPVIIGIKIALTFLFYVSVVVFVAEIFTPLIFAMIFWSKNLFYGACFNCGHWFGKNNGHLSILAMAIVALFPAAAYKVATEPSWIANCFRSVYNSFTPEIKKAIIVSIRTLSQGLIEIPEKFPLKQTSSPQWLLAFIFMSIVFVIYAPIAEREEVGEEAKKFISFFSEKGKKAVKEVSSASVSSTEVEEGKQHGAGFFLVIALLGEYLWRAISKFFHLKERKD